MEDRCLLSFGPVVNYAAGDSPRAIGAGDFNDDGRVDGLDMAQFNQRRRS